jgi:hypothetical protein
MTKTSKKVIFTWTVTQWYCMTDAMLRMAEVAHSENIPVNWQLDFATATVQKNYLDSFHEQFGDEIVIIKHDETMEDWHTLLPWAKLNISTGSRCSAEQMKQMINDDIEGVWGFCDQQIGIDGITHWGCPWGMFYLSENVPFIPSQKPSKIVGIPWTLRDIHKCYHLKQAINFCVDPIEHIRSKTLCNGENITFFQDLYDELEKNAMWNDRVYACCHEEADGAFIFPGKECSNEGANSQESEAMYEMMRQWLKYVKLRGASIMTLPQAVEDFKNCAKDTTLPSTILTTDKHHGRIKHYVMPVPEGVQLGEMGTSGHFPDTLFHFDNDCMLVFVHPEMSPQQILNYSAQYEVNRNKPYPAEQVKPLIYNWSTKRYGNERIFTYKVQYWFNMPYGICEWGNFEGWEVAETNGKNAKIVDNRVLLLRINFDKKNVKNEDINQVMQVGNEYWVKLRRKEPAINN